MLRKVDFRSAVLGGAVVLAILGAIALGYAIGNQEGSQETLVAEKPTVANSSSIESSASALQPGPADSFTPLAPTATSVPVIATAAIATPTLSSIPIATPRPRNTPTPTATTALIAATKEHYWIDSVCESGIVYWPDGELYGVCMGPSVQYSTFPTDDIQCQPGYEFQERPSIQYVSVECHLIASTGTGTYSGSSGTTVLPTPRSSDVPFVPGVINANPPDPVICPDGLIHMSGVCQRISTGRPGGCQDSLGRWWC